MTNKKHLFWMGIGFLATSLVGLLAFMATEAIIWTPLLIEIASVTWNDSVIA